MSVLTHAVPCTAAPSHRTRHHRVRPALALDGSEVRALTGLRIVAAAWVLVFHLQHTPGDPYARFWEPLRAIAAAGAFGVDLFFVLSGFVIAYTYLDRLGRMRGTGERVRASVSFLWARVARIWPVYLLVTVGFGLVLAAGVGIDPAVGIPFRSVSPTQDLQSWAAQAFGVQQWLAPSCDGCSFVASGWSVSAEWLAYACFPVLVLALWRAGRLPGPALAGLAVLAMTPLAVLVASHGDLYFRWAWLVRIGGGFLAGALGYLAVRRVPRTRLVGRLAGVVAAACLVAVPAVLLWGGTSAGIVVILFPVLIAALALSDGRLAGLLSAPWPVHGGRISYSLYLVHLPVFEMFWAGAARAGSLAPGLPGATWLAPHAVLLAVLLAHLLFRYVEEPARRWLRRLDPVRRRGRRVSTLTGAATTQAWLTSAATTSSGTSSTGWST